MLLYDQYPILVTYILIKFIIARIHSQFESLGFVGKYDQSPTNIVKSWTLKYGGADFLQNPRIFSLQNGPRMRAYISSFGHSKQ
jgi:hypothetical protein